MELFFGGKIITGASSAEGALVVDNGRIIKVSTEENAAETLAAEYPEAVKTDLKGLCIMAGGIDAHVHFREPGATGKADMETESRAALLGGITSVMDMPNTKPATTSIQAVKDKIALAQGRMWTNYAFHIGATNDNADEIAESAGMSMPGLGAIKVFLGSSTGNMLVDNQEALDRIFSIKTRPVLIHSEDENIIKKNLLEAKEKYGDDVPFEEHPNIRSRKACIMSSIRALEKAMDCGTHLHLLHVTTAEEVHMIRAAKIQKAKITGETSLNYMTFCDEDYAALKGKVKCNPAVKTAADRQLLRDAFHDGIIDTIGSDHAPHLLSEKDAPYLNCPSGVPSVQQSLSGVITVALDEKTPLEKVASAMSERAADIFGIKDRGYLKEGYIADMVVFDPEKEFTVGKPAYKCGWTPYEGRTFKGWIKDVYLAGRKVVADGVLVEEKPSGQPLLLKPLRDA